MGKCMHGYILKGPLIIDPSAFDAAEDAMLQLRNKAEDDLSIKNRTAEATERLEKEWGFDADAGQFESVYQYLAEICNHDASDLLENFAEMWSPHSYRSDVNCKIFEQGGVKFQILFCGDYSYETPENEAYSVVEILSEVFNVLPILGVE